MDLKQLLQYFIGGFICIMGLWCLISSLLLTPPLQAMNEKAKEKNERTFTQASIWLIGGLIIVFA